MMTKSLGKNLKTMQIQTLNECPMCCESTSKYEDLEITKVYCKHCGWWVHL